MSDMLISIRGATLCAGWRGVGMKAEESWPALETTALIGVIAERGESFAAAWQIPDRLVAAIGYHRFVLWAGGPADAAHRQLAAIGATNSVVE